MKRILKQRKLCSSGAPTEASGNRVSRKIEPQVIHA